MSLCDSTANLLNSFARLRAPVAIALFLGWGFIQVVSAQDAVKTPDLSGRWVSETVKVASNYGRPFPGSPSNVKIELIVEQAGNELRVKEISSSNRGDLTRESVYYLDGRGEANSGRTKDLIYDSKTEIVNGKLLIKSVIRPRNSPAGSIHHTEEWEISSDRRKLQITTVSGSGGVRNETVFRLEP